MILPHNENPHLSRAEQYSMLMNYHKYSNPDLFVSYYYKHLASMQRGIEYSRNMEALKEAAKQTGRIRFFHAAPDTGNADIYLNETKILANFPYGRLSDYLTVPQGNYQIDIYPAGNQTDTFISRKISVLPLQNRTLAAAGQAGKWKLAMFEDEHARHPEESGIRLVNLLTDLPLIDLAVKGGPSIIKRVEIRKASPYLAVTPGSADLEVRAAGTKDVLFSLPAAELAPGESLTIFAAGVLNGPEETAPHAKIAAP